jgi:hypothetical protein
MLTGFFSCSFADAPRNILVSRPAQLSGDENRRFPGESRLQPNAEIREVAEEGVL